MNAIDQLIWVADAALGERPVPREVASAFKAAVQDIAAGRSTADEALGLSVQRGGRKVSTMTALEARDEIVRRALVDFNVTSVELEAALRDYRSRAWPHDRTAGTCPGRHAGTVRAACWQILKLKDCTLSDRQIRAIAARPSNPSP